MPDIKRSGLREIKTNPLTDGEALYAKNLPEVFYNKAANSDERYIIEEFFKKNPPIENFPHDINYQIATQKAIIENQMGRSIDMMGVGVDQAISLLTRQANKLVRTKYYTTSLSKYVYIDASVQHWFTKEVVTYELPALHDDFVLGIANHRYGQAKTTLVEPMFSMKDMNIYSWKKHCNWTDEEVKTYDAAGVYRRLLGSLLDLKQVALKANCDLGFQKFLMLGHPDAPEYKSFMSYVTMSADVFPTTLIPDKPFSQMHTGEIEKWCASVLNQYKLNTKQIMLPNRLLLPPSEFIALGMSGSPQISARSKAEIIMGFFKNVRSDFQIEECIYLAKE
ncbi:MAG: hypothetical protein E7Y34_02250, partial [Mycoplasma sp.]|nr:hypothetical protein [Mycoplasma sp.]